MLKRLTVTVLAAVIFCTSFWVAAACAETTLAETTENGRVVKAVWQDSDGNAVGIFPGDYVFVKRQQTANEGDLVIALFDGKNNLKKLGFDPKNKKYILHSCNPDTKTYPDIIVDELQIQGVVKGSYHKH